MDFWFVLEIIGHVLITIICLYVVFGIYCTAYIFDIFAFPCNIKSIQANLSKIYLLTLFSFLNCSSSSFLVFLRFRFMALNKSFLRKCF